MSRRTFHSFQSDSAPSAAGAEANDEDDSPAKLSLDSASQSEDAKSSMKPSKVKGLSTAPHPRAHNRTWKGKLTILNSNILIGQALNLCVKILSTGMQNYKI